METLSVEAVAMIGTTIAVELSKDKNIEELNVIRNLASQIASTLTTIISQQILIKTKCDKNKL